MRKKKPSLLEDLTLEQQGALVSFAVKHGPDWKDKLLTCWLKAGCEGMSSGQWAPLQQIRNQFGPAWLAELNYVIPPLP